jgi:hypothetical protein
MIADDAAEFETVPEACCQRDLAMVRMMVEDEVLVR